MKIRKYGNTYCLPLADKRKSKDLFWEIVLGARRTRTRVGNEVARNQLASRQPRTSPLCFGQSHPSFVHIPSPPPDPLLGTVRGPATFLRSVVSTRTPVATSTFFVLIIILRHILAETNEEVITYNRIYGEFQGLNYRALIKLL